ncbi:LysR substrate-binding domain-containing protein [Ectopseudomonas mendocina]|uniref:LysR substrate-binding domain-containing protein n=1 Tax=Ectopseudomonas mendocina TaxID=300 RepID=A0ABZ2RKW0_ECTME
MNDLNDLFYFAKVVECGGFAAAERMLGIPKSRLSRRIAELEKRLNVRLLSRTTRMLALTEVGQRYLRHCQAMLLEAERAEETIASLTSEPAGRLRISAPSGLRLAEVISSFLSSHPKVQLELVQTNRRVDLLNEGIDVALRIRTTDDEEPDLICRRLQPSREYVVAAPQLLHGASIQTPVDLHQLPALGSQRADRKIHLLFQNEQGEHYEAELEPRLACEDFNIRKQAALDGLGFTMLPEAWCQNELADGQLIRLLPDWFLASGNLQAVYTHRRGMLPAVRAWIEHLTDSYSSQLLHTHQ